MSNQGTKGPKPPSPEEINKLREELHSLKLTGALNDLDDNKIEEILHLPPSLFYDAIRCLGLAFGPLSSFPVAGNPRVAITPQDNLNSSRVNLINDGESLLEDALDALSDYNKLLEEKVTKFSTQSARSLAILRESSESDHNITALHKKTAETKSRKTSHAQQISILKDSLDSGDKNRALRLEESNRLFWDKILFNCYDTFFDDSHQVAQPAAASSKGLWDEYDYILQHIERWRRLVNVDSDEGEPVIDRARHHVNQLVYSITRHCQVQLAIVFHDSLASNDAKSGHHKALHDEAADIVKEIDWLWEEVIPVAHMSVSAQFLRPVLKQFEDWERSKTYRDAVVTTYASGVLKFMNDRLSAVAERTKILIHHHRALNDVAWIRQSKMTSSPVNQIPGHIPRTLAQNTQVNRQHAKASENLRAFMQIYGAVPIHADNSSPNPTPSLLDEYVRNRAHKGDTLLQDLHKHFEAAAKSGLTDAELGGELLLDSLLADSAASPAQPGSVYKDTQLEGSVAVLQGQTAHIQEIFKGLKFEGPASALDYAAHSYRQTLDRLAGKVGGTCSKAGENPNSACMACVRCLKFEEFVQKWGC